MMGTEHILDRYNELYDIMSSSDDLQKMHIFGEAERWAFAQVAAAHPEIAEKWLAKIEAVDWNNYLSEDEAGCIVSKMVGQSGREGPEWSMEEVEKLVKNIGGNIESAPFYNRFALYVAINAIASDHRDSIRSFLPEQDFLRLSYKMAVDKLTDADRRQYIRAYYNV